MLFRSLNVLLTLMSSVLFRLALSRRDLYCAESVGTLPDHRGGGGQRSLTRKAYRLLRYTMTDWRFPLYKAYVPIWRYRMARKGVDLAFTESDELGLNPATSFNYEDSEAPFLAAVLKRLKVTDGDAILDCGAGKGGALVTMSRFPFRKVAGVEISPRLAETARLNLHRLGIDHVSLLCHDAATFTDLDEFTFIYFFNPFPQGVMAQVLDRIRESADRRPRAVTLIYCNPTCHETLMQVPGVRFEWSYFHFGVYTLTPESVPAGALPS